MAEYRFLTTWLLDPDPAAVWNAIYEADRWPEWGRAVQRVPTPRDGDESGCGALYRHRWRSRVPYAVEFEVETTRVESGSLIEAVARGELAGEGRFRFWQGSAVRVTYGWNVRTTVPWMNAVAPLARPVFEANHHAIMRWGGESLARLLGARLLAHASG